MPADLLSDNLPENLAPLHAPNGRPARSSANTRWQRRLLPFLVGMLGVLTLLFCVAIGWETHHIQDHMESGLQLDLRPAVDQEFRSNAAFLLEADLIERRYRAADAAALSRIYLMFMGFGTGMVMALVGAAFILGKISEAETSIDGAGSSFKASLHSGSPGVILAFLGTVLMLSTIFSKTEISVSDRAVYLGGGSAEAAAAPEPKTAEAVGQPAGAQRSASAARPVAEAKDASERPDLHLVMTGAPTLDGVFALSVKSEPGTLSVHGRQVKFTTHDGKALKVEAIAIQDLHLAFTVVEPDDGRQQFDGFLNDAGDIVGSTSYHGSYTTAAYGFTATRIKQK